MIFRKRYINASEITVQGLLISVYVINRLMCNKKKFFISLNAQDKYHMKYLPTKPRRSFTLRTFALLTCDTYSIVVLDSYLRVKTTNLF